MTSIAERAEQLLGMLQPVPKEWTEGGKKKDGGKVELTPSPCSDYRELTTAWRKALRWTDGLDHGLCVMLASIASTGSVGDQLWVKVMGPASCGKSTLCEAVSVCKKYVTAKSTIRGFHSGYIADGEKGKDNSLIPLIMGKTLVTKDGDTLLQSPNLGQILSEARDLYDSTARTHYRNTRSQDYEGIRMTWILCGTASLRVIDVSELGERFLDCVIMGEIDDEMEDDVLWRVANRADRNLGIEADGKPETQYDPPLLLAMRLTGGYVEWLRDNAADVLPTIGYPTKALRQCTKLGKFTAFMRANPGDGDDGEREFAARLVSQLTRLGKCTALVLNAKEVDNAVMDRVARVALDTSRGISLEMSERLYGTPSGMRVSTLGLQLGLGESRVRNTARFLRRIGVTESFVEKKSRQVCWRLTDKFRQLYEEVRGDAKD